MPVCIMYSPVRIIHAVSPSVKRNSPFRKISSEYIIKITPPKVGSGENLLVKMFFSNARPLKMYKATERPQHLRLEKTSKV